MKIKSNSFPNIYIQPIHEKDASDTYVNWLNDPQVNQYLETRFEKQTLISVQRFIKNTIENQNEYLFSIRLIDNNLHIGNIKLGNINHNHKVGCISLFIGDKNYWRKGYASQAIQLISEFSFNRLGIRKLSAGAYKPNIASTKSFLKAGYIYDGILTNHYMLNDIPCDLVQVCLFNKHNAL